MISDHIDYFIIVAMLIIAYVYSYPGMICGIVYLVKMIPQLYRREHVSSRRNYTIMFSILGLNIIYQSLSFYVCKSLKM